MSTAKRWRKIKMASRIATARPPRADHRATYRRRWSRCISSRWAGRSTTAASAALPAPARTSASSGATTATTASSVTPEDKIRLLGFGFDSFCDLSVVTNGANTVIDLATGTSVTLLDAAPDQLSPDDFLFA